MQLTTHILSVTSRVTGGGRTLYDVACGDGVKYTVWEAPLANALQAYAGQPQQAVLDTDSSPSRDGRFTNHTIRALLGNGPVAQPPMAVTPMAPPAGVTIQPVPQPFTGNSAPIQPTPPRDNMPPDTVARITKMGCLGYAATLVGALYQGAGPEALAEATDATLKTAQTLYKAARSHEAGQGTTVLQQSAQGALVAPMSQGVTTGAEIAAAVPGVTVGAPVAAPVASDDIPWD